MYVIQGLSISTGSFAEDNSHWKNLANFTVDNSDTVFSKYESSLTGKILLSFYSAINFDRYRLLDWKGSKVAAI